MTEHERILELAAEIRILKNRMAVLTTDVALVQETVEALAPRIERLVKTVNDFVGRFSVA